MRLIASDPAQEVLRTPPTGREITARSSDGTQLHAEEFGPSDGQTVVLAHGWTETLQYWIYVTRALTERGFRVVAYDLRGHGSSEAAAQGDYSIQRFGEDLEAILDAALTGSQRAVIAGHSLGAMSIVAWAEHHEVARRASAVALLNTGVGDLMTEQLLIPLPALANVLNKLAPPQRVLASRAPLPRFSTPLSSAMIRYVAFGPEATPAQIAFYERMLIASPPDARADTGIAISAMELHHALPRITVPALVLGGEKDRLTPSSHARRIASELPNLQRLIILPDTGHMGPLERPREITEALVELATIAADAPVSLQT
jgi:pimeloyl-ACP methyl ester carboxylesterase